MTQRDYDQITWNAEVEDDCRQLVRLAVREDLERQQDWTTLALVANDKVGAAALTPRQSGIVSGLQAAGAAIAEMETSVEFQADVADGNPITAGNPVGILRGPVRDILTCERIVLNLIGRLSGIATLTQQFVQAARSGGPARVYDTRKTTPGWRRLEKHAVRCGGGFNHRLGLFDGILIKDNHLAAGRMESGQSIPWTPSEAVSRARDLQRKLVESKTRSEPLMIEIEVDTLQQLANVLPSTPDIVLLDNMTPDELKRAVAMRDQTAPRFSWKPQAGSTSIQSLRSPQPEWTGSVSER